MHVIFPSSVVRLFLLFLFHKKSRFFFFLQIAWAAMFLILLFHALLAIGFVVSYLSKFYLSNLKEIHNDNIVAENLWMTEEHTILGHCHNFLHSYPPPVMYNQHVYFFVHLLEIRKIK